jgi:L-aminoadipate-semialdehyde dehydrogenase
VFDSDYYINSSEGKVAEDDNLEGGKGLTVGYGQSKWVSERLLLEARRRKIPVTITRPGYIVGHSTTGGWTAPLLSFAQQKKRRPRTSWMRIIF